MSGPERQTRELLHSIANMPKHTPGPWYAVTGDRAVTIGAAILGEHAPLATVDYTEENAQANAAFIVRACNVHDDLLAALRELEAFGEREELPTVLAITRAAIAKATQE